MSLAAATSSATPPAAVLTSRERDTARALADTIMPAGAFFPGGGRESTLRRYEAYLASLGPDVVSGVKRILGLVDLAAAARRAGPFAALPFEARYETIQALHRAPPTRLLLRLATAPLRVAHYDDPALFNALGCVYQPAKAAPERSRWRSQVLDGRSGAVPATLDCDVVVIGTGAGGAVVAKELAAAGHAVVLLEEGRFFDRADFTSLSRVELNRQMYRGGGIVPVFGPTPIALMVGKTVGGSTTVNSGTCFRTPDSVLRRWQRELGLTEHSPEAMRPYFERVERTIGVEPARWEVLGGVAEVIRRGAEALGYHHHPLNRNAPECDGQGVCCFGCPTDAKRSMNVSYVPLAIKAGAQLVTEARVHRVLVENGVAVGVEAALPTLDGAARTLTVRAQHVVLAAGTLHSPLLLLQNGLCNRFGRVGRGLTIHPAMGLGAILPHRVEGWRGVPQGYCIDEFANEGLMFEGAFVPMEMATMAFPLYGPEFTELMESFDRLAVFGFMLSDKSEGRVRVGPKGAPLVTYALSKSDRARIQRGIGLLSDVFFAAGASEVITPVFGHERLRSRGDLENFRTAHLRPWDLEMSAYHPLGTCRMGTDPRTSVVDGDHETHEVRRLYVVDGSSVPGSLGVNPQVTIMALATRFAERLDARLSRS